MKVRFIITVLAFSFLCVSISAQDFKTLKDGVEYAQVRREFSGKDVNINLLRLDLRKVRLDVHHAMDEAIGTEKTSSIAARKKAFAAINAGFFRLDTSQFAGDSAGLLVIDGRFLSEGLNDRIQLLINNRPKQTEVFMTRTGIFQSVTVGETRFEISGVNRERQKDEAVIYTPAFGGTTLTGGDGVEIVVINGRIVSIINGLGNSAIPPNGYVISASGAFHVGLEAAVKIADTIKLVQRWDNLPSGLVRDRNNLDVVAGTPQLIKNSRIDVTWEQEKSSRSFVETRHPRTAVAKLKDGKFLMITVDGRSESSAGINLYDLASYLLELGASDALNLDGGGSTTMFVNGRLVNQPSDKSGERKVSDAILVTPRATIGRKKAVLFGRR